MSQAGAAEVAIDGRPLGRRAQQTRRRLLDATSELLVSHSIRELRVVEIARKVGTSPATFYQYFRSVDEAVLVLSEELADELSPLVRLLDSSLNGKGGLDCARALVDGFIGYWDRHRAVMRVRNLAAEEDLVQAHQPVTVIREHGQPLVGRRRQVIGTPAREHLRQLVHEQRTVHAGADQLVE